MQGWSTTRRIVSSGLLVSLLSASASGQEIAYDTLGNSFSTAYSYVVTGPVHPTLNWTTGFKFVSGITGYIVLVEAPLQHWQGQGEFRFEFWTDVDDRPGVLIGFTPQVPAPAAPEIVAISVQEIIELAAGQAFWIIMRGSGDSEASWFQSETGLPLPRVWSVNQGQSWLYSTTHPAAAFRITMNGVDCYANCDGSTVAPVLNVDDFTCFINQFAIGQSMPHHMQVSHYANCDGSTSPPALNVDDFTCFINIFASGCR